MIVRSLGVRTMSNTSIMSSAKPLEAAKRAIVNEVLMAAKELYPVLDSNSSWGEKLYKATSQPRQANLADLAIPCAILSKTLKMKPNELATLLAGHMQGRLPEIVESVAASAIYLNVRFSMSLLGSAIPLIQNTDFLKNRPVVDGFNADRVMIEYSQPNTHKAFHVGHMRNAALGGALVRLYRSLGHPTTAANYFGDEGAHVAKCLWGLRRRGTPIDQIDFGTVSKGEWIGQIYVEATDALDLETMTSLPFPGVYSARVLSKEPHPENPLAWNIVRVLVDEVTGEEKNVVCGGQDYEVGDVVAYLRVGATWKRKEIIEKDMKGVVSCGVMLAFRELGVTSPTTDKAIFVLPAGSPVGVELTEIGRLTEADIPANVTVAQEHRKRTEEVRETLRLMESRDPELMELWDITKKWSLDEFHEIYSWLGCPFDHEFYESEVGDESKEMVLKYRDEGVLVDSEGAVGAELSAYKLGFCVLLKSDGTGLYATKDLALAHRKFTQFDIERSIYIVDASQTLHFKQVFKTLELMGYDNAKKCFHLPYGQVRVPGGKMSSRKGNIVYFSSLKQQLGDQIHNDFLVKNTDWDHVELADCQRALSIATIIYGMLTVDPAKDITFEMHKWAAQSGDTGVYLMYGYSRTRAILRKVALPSGVEFDATVLGAIESERYMLIKMLEFWDVVERSAYTHKPSVLCGYLFDLTKLFMSWYQSVGKIKDMEDETRKFALLGFVDAFGITLKSGMALLGVDTVERM